MNILEFTLLLAIGSFVAGADALSRRFAITTDLRLVPATKIKPDTGSPWHGVELGEDVELRVWDSSSDMRYFVLPRRPAGSSPRTLRSTACGRRGPSRWRPTR